MVAHVQARGHTIRRKREGAGYGLRAFADVVGVSPSWLSRIERDLVNPSPDVLRRIALALQKEQRATAAIKEIAEPTEQEQ